MSRPSALIRALASFACVGLICIAGCSNETTAPAPETGKMTPSPGKMEGDAGKMEPSGKMDKMESGSGKMDPGGK